LGEQTFKRLRETLKTANKVTGELIIIILNTC
jgi:hypothetical protein